MTVEEVLEFWLDDVGPSGWFASDSELDAEVKDRFEQLWWNTVNGANGLWQTYPSGLLAYLILMDQMPRNMFRGQRLAFASDRFALSAAKIGIRLNWDLRIDEPARQFFYLPLMHSESLTDQERAVRLFCDRMPETGGANLLHAKAHREEIRLFGRFPGRNSALGRAPSQAEMSYQVSGGYGVLLRAQN